MAEKGINKEYIIRDEVSEEFPYIISVTDSEDFKKLRIMVREKIENEDDEENKFESLYTFMINPLHKCISKKVENHNLGNNSAMVTRILNLLKIDKFVDEKTYFSHDLWKIPFRNGYYDVKSEEFKSKEKYPYKNFFYEIPHSYNEDFKGDCPIFKHALIQWLYGQYENPTKPDDMFQIMGYLMTMNTNLKKAFYIYGGLNSGKTTFENILLHVIGKKNRANISLQRMVEDRFGTNGLQLKILNMVGDHGSEEIRQLGMFKELTGGDSEVAVEIKGISKGKFINHCKLIFAGNSLPRLANPNDSAFYFRWILINFANSFDVTKDPFSDKIINNPNEVQGIIHECVKGVVQLYKNGNFSKELTKDTRHFWLYNSNPLYRFVKDRCIEESKASVTCEDFKKRFQRYVVENKLDRVIFQQKITNQLESMLIYRKQKVQIDNDRRDRYMDIRFMTKEEIIADRMFDEHLDLHEKELEEKMVQLIEMNELKDRKERQENIESWNNNE